MRRIGITFLAALLLLVFGCASSTTVAPLGPELEVEQLPPSEFDVQQRGATSVAYRMTVRNRSTEPIRLRRVEMKAVGRSPYLLVNEPVTLDQTIEAGQESVVAFSMWAHPREGRSAAAKRVWLRGTAHFEAGTRTFQKVFEQTFMEPQATE